MKITLTPKKVFEMSLPDGTTRIMEQDGPPWNSLLSLRSDDGETLIVHPATTPMVSAVNALFSLGPDEYYVISGSPSLIATLNMEGTHGN